eukprot:754388-Hanusia_phi.AAC.3
MSSSTMRSAFTTPLLASSPTPYTFHSLSSSSSSSLPILPSCFPSPRAGPRNAVSLQGRRGRGGQLPLSTLRVNRGMDGSIR